MDDIICISSDEERSLPKNNAGERFSFAQKTEESAADDEDSDIVCQVVIDGKRKASTDMNQELTAKKKKPSDSYTNNVVNNNIPSTFKCQGDNIENIQTNSNDGHDRQMEKKEENADIPVRISPTGKIVTKAFKVNEGASTSNIIKPSLVVRKKISLTKVEPDQDLFISFLDACIGKDRSKDMKKIIDKLRKRHEYLDPYYAESEDFKNLLRKKRNLILYDANKVYIHIAEVMNEMKVRQVNDKNCITHGSENHKREVAPKSPENKDVAARDISEEENEASCNETPDENYHENRKLLKLEITMRRCERRIKKLEEAEVDFDDENNSRYIQLERYKRRMVELFNKYCEISGENADAARPYLRPKHLNVSPIPLLNQAIESFVNANITKRNQLHKKARGDSLNVFTNALIFPDYVDILQCVEKCNKEQNLGLNKTQQEKMAETAFVQLGKDLKRFREEDYWDTFSLYLDKEEESRRVDPAEENEELAEKLRENRELGREKMANVFEEFVKKEEEAELQQDDIVQSNISGNDETDDEENSETEKESDEDDDITEEEKNRAVTDDEDNHQTAKEKKCESMDVDRELNGKVIPQTDENQAIETKDRSLPPSSESNNMTNTCLNITKGKNDGASVEPEEKSDAQEGQAQDSPSVATTYCGELDSTGTRGTTETGRSQVPAAVAETEAEIKTTVTVADADVDTKTTIAVTKEEEKPILRLRSFAKPPGFWKDSQEILETTSCIEPHVQTMKTVAEKDVKSEDIITLNVHDRITNKPSTISPGKIVQLNSQMFTTLKNKDKTVLIPTNLSKNNVINVKNVTNNYTVNLNNQTHYIPPHAPSLSPNPEASNETRCARNIVSITNKRNSGGVMQVVSVTCNKNNSDTIQQGPCKTIISVPPGSTDTKITASSERNMSKGQVVVGPGLTLQQGPYKTIISVPPGSTNTKITASSERNMSKGQVVVGPGLTLQQGPCKTIKSVPTGSTDTKITASSGRNMSKGQLVVGPGLTIQQGPCKTIISVPPGSTDTKITASSGRNMSKGQVGLMKPILQRGIIKTPILDRRTNVVQQQSFPASTSKQVTVHQMPIVNRPLANSVRSPTKKTKGIVRATQILTNRTRIPINQTRGIVHQVRLIPPTAVRQIKRIVIPANDISQNNPTYVQFEPATSKPLTDNVPNDQPDQDPLRNESPSNSHIETTRRFVKISVPPANSPKNIPMDVIELS